MGFVYWEFDRTKRLGIEPRPTASETAMLTVNTIFL